MFKRLAVDLNENAEERDPDSIEWCRFIHLQDVELIVGNEKINIPLWRGRVESIDGFSFGNITSVSGIV